MEKYLTKYWPILVAISTALFMTAGVVMSTVSDKYFKGIQYLLTALLFVISINYITDKNFNAKKQTELKFFLFNTGFILAFIGLEIHFAVWIIGMILLVAAMCKQK